VADEISFEDFTKAPDPEVEASIKARRLNTRDATLARTVAGDPRRQSADEADDQTLSNINELESQISRTKDPKRKAILVAEHNRIKGEIGKRITAEDGQAPFPLSLIPSARAHHEQSETVQNAEGKWINVYGKNLPKAGQQLPGTEEYETSGEAVAAARARSKTEGAKEMSFDEFVNPVTPKPFQVGKLPEYVKIAEAVKKLDGSALALGDMILGLPAFVSGFTGGLGAGIGAGLQGADRKLAWQAAKEGKQYFAGPAWFNSPLGTLVKKLGGGDLSDSYAGQGLEKLTSLIEEAGDWTEKKSQGSIPAESVGFLADAIMLEMGPMGARAVKAVKGKLKERAEAKSAAEANVKAEELTPEEFIARVPVQQQIHEMLGIRTPAEQAKITRERRKNAQSAFTDRPAELTPEQTAELEMRGTRIYDSTAESQFRANERMGQSEILEVLQKEPAERSPADIAMLRMGQEAAQAQRAGERVAADMPVERISMEEAMEIAQKPQEARTNVENTKFRQWASQKGSVSADALGLLAAAGIGTTAGALLDDNGLRGAVLGGAAGLGLAMLMRGPGKVQSRFGQAGAVKGPGGMWHPEAVQRLATPLQDTIISGTEAAEWSNKNPGVTHPADAWSMKAIRNYLNKYAGTEKDPLKDVEIPALNAGTRKWGEAATCIVRRSTSRTAIFRAGE